MEVKFDRLNNLKTEFINSLKSDYQFDGFHHYTDFLNFTIIMKEGELLCRNEAQKCGYFHDAAEQRVIDKTSGYVKNYVRFYYKENTPTIYVNEGIKFDNSMPHMPIPVLLLFNEDIINYGDIAFTSGCGGSEYSQFTDSVQTALNFDWKTIFNREWIPRDEDSILRLGYDRNKANVINKRNAEFLFKQKIDIKHIKKIVFRSPADLKRAKLVLGENHLFNLNAQKFNNHRSYLRDYSIVNKQESYFFTLKFHVEHNKHINNYSHDLKIIYNCGFSEIVNIASSNKRIINKATINNNVYYFDFIPLVNRTVNKIGYLMNGHLSALWKGNRV